MADFDYPASLPKATAGSFEETTIEPWVSDQGEVGSTRRRKRFTRELHGFTYSLRLDNDQKNALLAFYDDTLDDGVDAFNWTHPLDGTVYEVRFAGRPKPKHFTTVYWDVDVTVEQI